MSKQATAKDVGLPVYPGAKAHKDEKDDSATVQMGLLGGAFGFKLAVMKMDSNDAPEKVAEFFISHSFREIRDGFELHGGIAEGECQGKEGVFEPDQLRR